MKQNSDERLLRLKQLLEEKKCTHILITDMIDCEYACGFHSSNVFLLISRSDNKLFTDFRYKEAARAFCRKNRQWRFIETDENGFSFLLSSCKKGSVIGIQSNCLSIDRFDEIKRRLHGIRFVKLRDAVTDLFISKSALEITSIKKAAAIGDRAYKRTLLKVKEGMTERHVALILEDECRRAGSEKPSFDTIVLFGRRTALPHGSPSDAILQKGDFVLFDFGCSSDGFISDMTRTVVAGKATAKQKEIYRIVADAQERARQVVTVGAAAATVDRCARQIIEEAGYGAHFGHAIGHGIGRRVHEKPRVARGNNGPLLLGSVITIEPGIYIPRFGGVRIEDMVVVRKDGGETVTSSPRQLIELTL